MPRRIRIAHDTADWIADVEGDRVTFPDAGVTFIVREESDGRFSVDGHGAQTAIAVVAGDTVWVGLDALALDFHVRRGDQRARSAARDQDALMPPMSATVVRIQARSGDRVEAGDTLIVLEAMKMELPIRAPRPGTVSAIHCVEGQLVHPGTILVELDD